MSKSNFRLQLDEIGNQQRKAERKNRARWDACLLTASAILFSLTIVLWPSSESASAKNYYWPMGTWLVAVAILFQRFQSLKRLLRQKDAQILQLSSMRDDDWMHVRT